MPLLEELQGYAWRRQLAAYLARMAAQGDAQIASGPGAAGDRLRRPVRASPRSPAGCPSTSCGTLLETFESLATDIVGERGGRIVKTIGDEILFQVETRPAVRRSRWTCVEAASAAPNLPELRAGLAYGEVVSRLGDVYGSTVNIASRLTSLSRPGWVLVDRELHDALEGDDRFRFKSRRPESVRGFHHLRQWRLRRAER